MERKNRVESDREPDGEDDIEMAMDDSSEVDEELLHRKSDACGGCGLENTGL